ncbi:MAG: DNA recombination protein RmuC [Bacteroidales bacterium]|jgi:DNA recombination protein RmuC|nr:DNA recombination protein RmuC [Bacteroidales bacterium]
MENIAIYSIIFLLLILIFFVIKYGSKQKNDYAFDDFKRNIKDDLSEMRKETRELNIENRKEINELFKGLQDSLLTRLFESIQMQKTEFEQFSKSLSFFTEKMQQHFTAFRDAQTIDSKENRTEVNKSLSSFEEKLTKSLNDFSEKMRSNFNDLNQQSKDSQKELKDTVEKQMTDIRLDNTKQLDEMRRTVDEKLQTTLEKRLGESFKQVSDRLEQVHKGLGEMQTLATGVGDLKKVLSNVKTRGIMGEYQLGNILEQLLTPDQYAKNVATKKGSQANVEYAIKLPGKSSDQVVWLPVDSKFPLESYNSLIDAWELGDKNLIESAQKSLLKTIESFAKDISSKYLDPPNTTDFAIMFLPVEGLYAEVLRHPGIFELLQRTYHITVTGPTTLSALLSSLQMGFRTLAVQKRSSEVWKVLEEVKTEFGKFSSTLEKAHRQIHTAAGTLDTLANTRARAMERKLKNVDSIESIDDASPSLLPDNFDETPNNLPFEE